MTGRFPPVPTLANSGHEWQRGATYGTIRIRRCGSLAHEMEFGPTM